MKTTSIVLAATATGIVAAAPQRHHELISNDLSKDLRHQVSHGEHLAKTLKAFERIAHDNGGDRASGSRGYTASADYVIDRINAAKSSNIFYESTETFNKTSKSLGLSGLNVYSQYDTSVQSFAIDGPKEGAISWFNPVPARLVFGHTSRDNACNTHSYNNNGKNVEDAIVLTTLGNCPGDDSMYVGRAEAAAAAGASAIVFYDDGHHVPDNQIFTPTSSFASSIPVGFMDAINGRALRKRMVDQRELPQAIFAQTRDQKETESRNVLAVSQEGDEKKMIIFGAHLDSHRGSPGIDDNASGATLLLELYDALHNVPKHFTWRNKIVFAWWADEVNGQLGSQAFVDSIKNTTSEKNIMAYVNFDMVARGGYHVLNGDGEHPDANPGPAGSGAIEQLFIDYFESAHHKTHKFAALSDNFDYSPFIDDLNVPVGGLTGSTAGKHGNCVGKKCDDYHHHDAEHLRTNTLAAAHVLGELVMNGQEHLN